MAEHGAGGGARPALRPLALQPVADVRHACRQGPPRPYRTGRFEYALRPCIAAMARIRASLLPRNTSPEAPESPEQAVAWLQEGLDAVAAVVRARCWFLRDRAAHEEQYWEYVTRTTGLQQPADLLRQLTRRREFQALLTAEMARAMDREGMYFFSELLGRTLLTIDARTLLRWEMDALVTADEARAAAAAAQRLPATQAVFVAVPADSELDARLRDRDQRASARIDRLRALQAGGTEGAGDAMATAAAAALPTTATAATLALSAPVVATAVPTALPRIPPPLALASLASSQSAYLSRCTACSVSPPDGVSAGVPEASALTASGGAADAAALAAGDEEEEPWGEDFGLDLDGDWLAQLPAGQVAHHPAARLLPPPPDEAPGAADGGGQSVERARLADGVVSDGEMALVIAQSVATPIPAGTAGALSGPSPAAAAAATTAIDATTVGTAAAADTAAADATTSTAAPTDAAQEHEPTRAWAMADFGGKYHLRNFRSKFPVPGTALLQDRQLVAARVEREAAALRTEVERKAAAAAAGEAAQVARAWAVEFERGFGAGQALEAGLEAGQVELALRRAGSVRALHVHSAPPDPRTLPAAPQGIRASHGGAGGSARDGRTHRRARDGAGPAPRCAAAAPAADSAGPRGGAAAADGGGA